MEFRVPAALILFQFQGPFKLMALFVLRSIIQRVASFVRRAQSADGIKRFQGEAQRVDAVMARRARLIGPVAFQALP